MWACCWLWLNASPQGLSLCVCVHVCVGTSVLVYVQYVHMQDGDVFQSLNAAEGNLDKTSNSFLSLSPVWSGAFALVVWT